MKNMIMLARSISIFSKFDQLSRENVESLKNSILFYFPYFLKKKSKIFWSLKSKFWKLLKSVLNCNKNATSVFAYNINSTTFFKWLEKPDQKFDTTMQESNKKEGPVSVANLASKNVYFFSNRTIIVQEK